MMLFLPQMIDAKDRAKARRLRDGNDEPSRMSISEAESQHAWQKSHETLYWDRARLVVEAYFRLATVGSEA
jgi:hypothetical protein